MSFNPCCGNACSQAVVAGGSSPRLLSPGEYNPSVTELCFGVSFQQGSGCGLVYLSESLSPSSRYPSVGLGETARHFSVLELFFVLESAWAHSSEADTPHLPSWLFIIIIIIISLVTFCITK